MTLDPVTQADLGLIADLANRAFGTEWRDAAWAESHAARHRVSWEDSRLARLGGEAAGYVLIGYPPDLGAEVTQIGVVPGARRQGVATALLEHAVATAARRGQEWLWLATDEENAAVACYRAAGFEVAKRQPTWQVTMPPEPPLSFTDNVVFRALEEPLEMYEWYDALPLEFDHWPFERYRYFPGRHQAVRATRHGETIASAYVIHAPGYFSGEPEADCLLAKLRLAEMADWIPEFLRAVARAGRPFAVTDASGRYAQWFASWGYTEGSARLWMRRRIEPNM